MTMANTRESLNVVLNVIALRVNRTIRILLVNQSMYVGSAVLNITYHFDKQGVNHVMAIHI